MRSGALRWSAEKTLHVRLLCTISWQPLLHDRQHTFADYYRFVFCLESNIRARRMWLHDMIRRRQKYSEYYHLGQKKEKKKTDSDITNAFLKSWEIFNSKCPVLTLLKGRVLRIKDFCMGGCLLPQKLAPNLEQLEKKNSSMQQLLFYSLISNLRRENRIGFEKRHLRPDCFTNSQSTLH